MTPANQRRGFIRYFSPKLCKFEILVSPFFGMPVCSAFTGEYKQKLSQFCHVPVANILISMMFQTFGIFRSCLGWVYQLLPFVL